MKHALWLMHVMTPKLDNYTIAHLQQQSKANALHIVAVKRKHISKYLHSIMWLLTAPLQSNFVHKTY